MKRIAFFVFILAFMCLPGRVMALAFKNAKIIRLKVESQEQPTFKPSKHAVGSSSGRWCLVEAEYTLDGPKYTYVDRVEIRWYLAVRSGNDNSEWIGLTRTTKYDNIEASKKHHVAVFIPPWFFERYVKSHRTEPTRVSAYLELYIGNEMVASKDHKGSGITTSKWWISMKGLKWQENGLLTRPETPFCWVDLHYYDQERPNQERTEQGKK